MAKRFWVPSFGFVIAALRLAEHFYKYGTSHFSMNGFLFGIFAALLFSFSITWFTNRTLSKQQSTPNPTGHRQLQLIILGVSLATFPGVMAFTAI